MFLWSLSSAAHVSHLENVSEEEMNRLLGIVLDVEYLFTCVHKEEDADTKQVYFYLFKVRFFTTLKRRFFFLSLLRCAQFLHTRSWVGRPSAHDTFALRVCGSMRFFMRDSLK